MKVRKKIIRCLLINIGCCVMLNWASKKIIVNFAIIFFELNIFYYTQVNVFRTTMHISCGYVMRWAISFSSKLLYWVEEWLLTSEMTLSIRRRTISLHKQFIIQENKSLKSGHLGRFGRFLYKQRLIQTNESINTFLLLIAIDSWWSFSFTGLTNARG